jgi:ankyrin
MKLIMQWGILAGLLAFLYCPTAQGDTDLWQAAAAGDNARLQSLIKESPDLNAIQPETGLNALMEAAHNNRHDSVRLLIESGASLEVYSSTDSTPLAYAAAGGDTSMIEYLLSKGAKIDGQIEGGDTPLMKAAESGSPEVLQLLIERGANIHYSGRDRLRAIHMAAVRPGPDKAKKVKLLVQAGAKPSAYSNNGWTPAMYAANWGNNDVVQAFLDLGVSPSEGNGGYDLLTIALRQANYELAQILVEAGADLQGDPNFSEPLAFAVNYGKLDFAKRLIERGAPISKYSSGLYGAAENGHHDCVELLAEHGSTLRQQSWLKINATVLERSYVRSHIAIIRGMRLDGAQTPEEREKAIANLKPAFDLLLAAHQGRTEDAERLVEAVMATEPWAVRDAVTYAKNEGQIDTIRVLQPLYYKAKRIAERKPDDLNSLTYAAKKNNAKTMKHLLEKKNVDPNYGDKNEYSPMRIAIDGGHAELVKLLLDHGADPDIDPGQFGRSPLAQACDRGELEIVKLILDAGADPDEGGDGFTPLYFSAGRNNIEITKLLIQAGAKVNLGCPGFEKRTALIEAAQKGHREIVEYLVKQGADPNQVDENGVTPLKMAADSAETEVARILIRHGATPPANLEELLAKITYGDTDNPRRIKMLLANGADPDALTENYSGRKSTPLGHALYRNYPKHDCVKLLLDAGADLKLIEGPLIKITTMKPETIELLIKSGADVNQPAPWFEGGVRPIFLAAADGKFDLMRRLLKAGADPDLRTVRTRLTLEQYVLNFRIHTDLVRKERAEKAREVIAQWEAELDEAAKDTGHKDE